MEYVARNQLHVSFSKPYLANEADVEEYLDQLKAAMLVAIKDGKRIQI